MAKKKVKATKLTVGLPFNLGQLELKPEVQQRAAWELYVELTTRIAVQPLGPDEGLMREAMSSLYRIFGATREILRQAGPSVAQGPSSFGPVAIEVLNKGIRPFLAKWHPLLLAYEQQRPTDVSARDHERSWEKASEFRQELASPRANDGLCRGSSINCWRKSWVKRAPKPAPFCGKSGEQDRNSD